MTVTETLAAFPRTALTHRPTPVEFMPNLSAAVGGVDLYVKRDDCTGLAMGGNKARQLEFYLGEALEQGASAVLITGAVQSNYVRSTAAVAAKLGLRCIVQLEQRVPDMSELYHRSGNVLLDHVLGAEVRTFREGENEAGADAVAIAIGSYQVDAQIVIIVAAVAKEGAHIAPTDSTTICTPADATL